MIISQFDLGWLIGILEGEGFFGLCGGNNSDRRPTISICSTDIDVVRKAAIILGGGGNIRTQIRKPQWAVLGKKPIYSYATNSNLAIKWMEILQPHMSNRRQMQIQTVLDYWQSRVRRKPNKTTVFPIIEKIS